MGAHGYSFRVRCWSPLAGGPQLAQERVEQHRENHRSHYRHEDHDETSHADRGVRPTRPYLPAVSIASHKPSQTGQTEKPSQPPQPAVAVVIALGLGGLDDVRVRHRRCTDPHAQHGRKPGRRYRLSHNSLPSRIGLDTTERSTLRSDEVPPGAPYPAQTVKQTAPDALSVRVATSSRSR